MTISTRWCKALLISASLMWGLAAHTALADALVVGVNASYKPLIFKEAGKLSGIEVDTARALGKRLNREVEFKELAWEALIPSLQQGKIDIIMSGMSITDERKALIDFSASYLEVGQMAIIASKNVAQLSSPRAIFAAGARIGVEPNTTGETFAKDMLVNSTLLKFASPEQAFAALKRGDIDAFIHDAPTSWKLAQSNEHSELLPLYRPLTRESLAWGVSKTNPELRQQVDSALAAMKADGSINQIQNHWMPVKIAVGL